MLSTTVGSMLNFGSPPRRPMTLVLRVWGIGCLIMVGVQVSFHTSKTNQTIQTNKQTQVQICVFDNAVINLQIHKENLPTVQMINYFQKNVHKSHCQSDIHSVFFFFFGSVLCCGSFCFFSWQKWPTLKCHTNYERIISCLYCSIPYVWMTF